jgi:murein DD-endopeptidase MepM/ murein hydrolase activator NlpD
MVTDIYSTVDSHRWCCNSEFAFDLGQLDNNLLFINKDYMDNKDFVHYGKEIVAAADGEVVDCFAGFPEHSLGYPNKMPREEYDRLEEKYGPVARTAGNYAVIRHLHDEYSVYCHMIPGSLTVSIGDRVNQGQAIGRVGNSGNSICPHLHYHLMDGRDILSARGLPCSFTNIKNIFNQYIDFPEEDGIIVFAE